MPNNMIPQHDSATRLYSTILQNVVVTLFGVTPLAIDARVDIIKYPVEQAQVNALDHSHVI